LQLRAEFLFIVQIILYVGGIMVLFVFVIMLVNLDVALQQIQFARQKWWRSSSHWRWLAKSASCSGLPGKCPARFAVLTAAAATSLPPIPKR